MAAGAPLLKTIERHIRRSRRESEDSMAVVSVRLQWSGRTSSGGEGNADSVRVFSVILDTASPTGEAEALNASDGTTTVPAYGDVDPAFGLPLRRKTIRSVSPIKWLVECYFSLASGGAPGENPLDQPAIVRVGGEVVTELADVDFDGRSFTNTAGVNYEPHQIDVSYPVVSVTKNLPSISIATINEYQNAINEDAFTIRGAVVQPGQALMRSIEAEEVRDAGTFGTILYIRATFLIALRPGLPVKEQPGGNVGGPTKAWWFRTASSGREVRTLIRQPEREGKREPPEIWAIDLSPVLHATGGRISGAVLLDKDGFILPEDQPPFIQEFRFHQIRNFQNMIGPID